jgi:hypothetical protein
MISRDDAYGIAGMLKMIPLTICREDAYRSVPAGEFFTTCGGNPPIRPQVGSSEAVSNEIPVEVKLT